MILEILQCIPVVIIFAFLDLGKKFLVFAQTLNEKGWVLYLNIKSVSAISFTGYC
jgi:hypothetical protein